MSYCVQGQGKRLFRFLGSAAQPGVWNKNAPHMGKISWISYYLQPIVRMRWTFGAYRICIADLGLTRPGSGRPGITKLFFVRRADCDETVRADLDNHDFQLGGL